MSAPFIFKQFQLNQANSGFKLGTDSVALACWLPINNYKNILDVGGGTGIISLIMAQRMEDANITAIEIDPASYNDLANNFTHSKWNNRLTAVNNDIIDWSNKNADKKFDLMISNPPYFTNQLKNTDPRKTNARHTASLNATSMGKILQQHLLPHGVFACILPAIEFNDWALQLKSAGFYAQQICTVSSFKDSEVIRKMGVFAMNEINIVEENQYLYNNNKTRSEWYKTITTDFYIK